jgi:DNA helicase-2/ATP-dependent DNA helicase PcrA
LVYNVNDDTAFERIVNQPPRGIGDKTMQQLRDEARGNSLSLWQAARKLVAAGALASRAATAINSFIDLILALQPIVQQTQIDNMLEQILERSELSAYYRKDRSEKGLAKIENLDELITVAKEFSPEANSELPPLAAFLAQAVLDSGEKEAALGVDAVQMMTLHSAKGLEFPIVFMCGMEEGLFPHYLSVNDGEGLAEERRLCYVGMTRAMKKLYMSYAQSRQMHGKSELKKHSRFLSEIPKTHIKKERLGSSFTPLRATSGYGFNLGERVRHPLFGEGTILAFEGSGDHARVQVQFVNFEHGTKWLVLSFAKLQKV